MQAARAGNSLGAGGDAGAELDDTAWLARPSFCCIYLSTFRLQVVETWCCGPYQTVAGDDDN